MRLEPSAGAVRRAWLTAAIVAALASAGVFWLPFIFPPVVPVPAQSYVVGYGNRVAVLCLLVLSAGMVLASARRGVLPDLRRPSDDARPVWWGYLLGAEVLVVLFQGWLSWRTYAMHTRQVEDFYFIAQLQKAILLGMKVYRDLDFSYGPILFYSPIWVRTLLGPLHLSIQVSYYVALVLQYAAGLAMLYWVANRLPMRRTLRPDLFMVVSLFHSIA